MCPASVTSDPVQAHQRGTVLRISNLSKSFPGVKALSDVAFDVHAGEIVSVVGQNGSGKSTLVKVLAGLYEPDPGAVLDHHELRIIHQDLGLVHSLSAIENLEIGRPLGRRGLHPLRSKVERAVAQEAVGRFGGSFDVSKPVGTLGAAERTVVAIVRALNDWTPSAGVLVLDEPTAALGAEEVKQLFTAIHLIAAEGAGVVFISHRLDEVLDLSDRIVALRGGRIVADVPAREVDHQRLVELITGRDIRDSVHGGGDATGPVVLRVENLVTDSLSGFDLAVREGEIVGMFGLLGSGSEKVAATIFGDQQRITGRVTVDGKDVPQNKPTASVRAGLAFVPADRLRYGAVMMMTVRENLTLPELGSLRRAFGRLDGRQEREQTRDWIALTELHPNLPERPLQLFSGGNQQKIVLAKWLRTAPRALLLDEPTQGVDIGAKAAIYALIRTASEGGAAVVVSSSDIQELMALCNRVLVLHEGVVVADIARAELTEARLIAESLSPSSPTSARRR